MYKRQLEELSVGEKKQQILTMLGQLEIAFDDLLKTSTAEEFQQQTMMLAQKIMMQAMGGMGGPGGMPSQGFGAPPGAGR